MFRWIALLLLGAVLVSQATFACVHLPQGYRGEWQQTSQEAMIFYRNGREELILRFNYLMKPEGVARIPKDFGWVIPVPTIPDRYRVTSSSLFDEAQRLAEKYGEPGAFQGAAGSAGLREDAPRGGVQVVDRARVGAYDITALKSTGQFAAEELNDWLKLNGYGLIPAANAQFYIDQDWTFLAVKVSKLGRSRSGKLNPLWISFASEKIYYPLKFSTHQGTFSIRAYVFSEGPVAIPKWLESRGLAVTSLVKGKPGSVSLRTNDFRNPKVGFQNSLYQMMIGFQSSKIGRFRHPELTVFSGIVNGEGNKLEHWNTDFELELRNQE